MQTSSHLSPLGVAIGNNQEAAVKFLLADPQTDIGLLQGRHTLLGYAVQCGDLRCLEAVLADGRVDVGGPITPTRPQMTCLHAAIRGVSRSLPMIRYLLRVSRGRVAVEAEWAGRTALYEAIEADWAEAARVLVQEGGADPMRRTSQVCYDVRCSLRKLIRPFD